MTIRQELLKQGEHKLDNYLERAGEALQEITDSTEMSELLCRILSTERNTSARTKAIRMFADEAEAEWMAKWNDQADLPLDESKEGKESL